MAHRPWRRDQPPSCSRAMSGGLLPLSPNSQARRIAANVAKLPDLVRTA